MPGRPSKPSTVIKMEKKSHRTKKELALRARGEEAVLTGVVLKEAPDVAANKRAHKEFLRLNRLLSKIEKSDDLYGNTINRYCMICAECEEFMQKRELTLEKIQELDARSDEMEFQDYLRLHNDLSKTLVMYDRQIQTKRKMMFDIEKESIMTIASALRSVPKEPQKKTNPLMEALNG